MNLNLKKWPIKSLGFLFCLFAVQLFFLNLSDSKKLLLAYKDVSPSIVSMVLLFNDLLPFLAIIGLCILFDKQRSLEAVSILTVRQLGLMLLSCCVFFVFCIRLQPNSLSDIYEIIHTLLLLSIVPELCFRGLLFKWLLPCYGKLSYLISGLAGGAFVGLYSYIAEHLPFIFSVLPAMLIGLLSGSILAFIYQKTDSLWVSIFLHSIGLLI